ncbi:MAG: BBP7 family outer membrane beta-barrel protein, partial [Pirellulales bacterium]|nr:BBP7 family outer membrane beta-barrel protein [Pirellulales bacterium]
MSLSSRVCYFLTALLAMAAGGTAGAQVWQPFGTIDYTHDLQPFAPFEIRNFSDQPGQRNGYFFSWDAMYWAMTGERNLIGSPNAQAYAMNLWPGTPFERPQVFNGLEDSAPNAKFANGLRYEFGYNVDHHGWLVSILDGPKASEIEEYGFADEIFEHEWIDYDGNEDEEDPEIVTFHPHPNSGRVTILFEMPPGYLDGFFFIDSDGDGSVDTPVDINGDGLLTYDDLVSYLTTYDMVKVSNWTEMDGVELMKTYRFKPTHRGSMVEFYYGARYLRFRDDFRVDASGGILTDLNLPLATADYDDRTDYWNTIIDNHIVGPQVGLKWYHQKGRWTINTQGRFTFGYNIQDHDQTGRLGT